jgi:hypothetical protein
MSKKGCSPDNAACKGFFGRLKNKMFYGRDWKGVRFKQFMAVLARADRYSRSPWFPFSTIDPLAMRKGDRCMGLCNDPLFYFLVDLGRNGKCIF